MQILTPEKATILILACLLILAWCEYEIRRSQ